MYLTPYALTGVDQKPTLDDSAARFIAETETSWDLGLDLRYALAGNLTLDLTANTDFAQVEADDE